MIKNISNLSKLKWLSVAISLIPIISTAVFIIAAYFETPPLSIGDFLAKLCIALTFLIFTLFSQQLSNLLLIFFSIRTQKVAVATKLLICSIANTFVGLYLTYWLPKSVAANDTTATHYVLLMPTLPLAVTLVLYVLLTVIFRIAKIMPSEKQL